MSELRRFSVSMESGLLSKFDVLVKEEWGGSRSKAISDLVRDKVVEENWSADAEVAGAIVMVYDHHKGDLNHRLTEVQHDFHHLVISTQHVHLNHDDCLEIVVVRGVSEKVVDLFRRLKSLKGVKHCSLVKASSE